MDNFNTGKAIAELRKEKGWTQLELSEKIGVSDKTISKWESENGLPDISFFPKLAEVFNVTIDFLLTGKKETTFSIEDLNATSRALFFIETDDEENFKKYNVIDNTIDGRILFSAQKINEQHLPLDYIKIRNKIVDCQSIKIFNLLATDLKKNLWAYGDYGLRDFNAPDFFCDYLDDFVKLLALTNQIELLSFIGFKFFSVALDINAPHDNRTINQETLDFIFMDERIPQDVTDYIGKYEQYTHGHYIGGCGLDTYPNSQKAIKMAGNIILSLYRSNRLDNIVTYIDSMREEAHHSFNYLLHRNNWLGLSENGYYGYYFSSYGYILYRDYRQISCLGKISTIDINLTEIQNAEIKTKITEYNHYIDIILGLLQPDRDNPTIIIPDKNAKEVTSLLNNQPEKNDQPEKKLKDDEIKIVELTSQLEQKLKASFGNDISLLDLIDMAFDNSLISDSDRIKLHNLRKKRNEILHLNKNVATYTKNNIDEWRIIIEKL